MNRRRAKGILVIFAVAAAAFAVATLSSSNAFAGHKPPRCPNCAPTITLPDGRVCTLSACGSDCVYTCPL